MSNVGTRPISDQPRSPPARLYKFEPFTARSLQNLKSQAMYFGSPRNFNDPYPSDALTGV